MGKGELPCDVCKSKCSLGQALLARSVVTAYMNQENKKGRGARELESDTIKPEYLDKLRPGIEADLSMAEVDAIGTAEAIRQARNAFERMGDRGRGLVAHCATMVLQDKCRL